MKDARKVIADHARKQAELTARRTHRPGPTFVAGEELDKDEVIENLLSGQAKAEVDAFEKGLAEGTGTESCPLVGKD